MHLNGLVPLMICGIASMLAAGIDSQAASIPSATAIPVVFTHTVDAGTAKPNQIVTARTTQEVPLPTGQVLPKGAIVLGHVVDSTPFTFDSAPYAVQGSSVLSIHFDKMVTASFTVSVSLSVRAISGPVQTHEAETMHYMEDFDSVGTRVLIGGNTFSLLERTVLSPEGDVVGYVRNGGVFARLIPSDERRAGATLRCDGVETEQPTGVFSADACGVYGMEAVSMLDNGRGRGLFVLRSRGRNVKISAGSAALLQVNEQ